ncbi:hypothetical protein Dsin_023662 [Dipteronia sinensis]|uniref:Reverse transcriptase domain-containing protein n=1 Tax=Dipteronia sinensis TaxID=43782 RepID=A0AAE0E2B5_9ROSI|nr:hypothetical protein Dsin_023662 [Dipteronia sinensis]
MEKLDQRMCGHSAVTVIVEGKPTSQFRVERGLRQGDPLSPFLFNIVVEGLNSLLVRAAELGLIEGERFEGREVHITHLHFTDDTILFIKLRIVYLLNAKRVLRCFEFLVGLRINFHKSGVVRVGGRGEVEPSVWAATFKCRKISLPMNYLGFPLGGKPGSKDFWASLVIKIEKCLAPWKRSFLSKGVRLVLIKSIAASMPMYFLSVFKITVGVAHNIEKLQRNFLWGDGLVKKKIHAVNWDKVCKNKHLGGLGISRIMHQNKAMLAKWIWRFGREKTSLWRRVICSKYKLHGGVFRCTLFLFLLCLCLLEVVLFCAFSSFVSSLFSSLIK